jgi:hypothetical protein
MTEAEYKRLAKAGLRSARRGLRSLDSHVEKVERWYNRMMKRKVRIRSDQLEPGFVLLDGLRQKTDAALLAATDFFSAVNM